VALGIGAGIVPMMVLRRLRHGWRLSRRTLSVSDLRGCAVLELVAGSARLDEGSPNALVGGLKLGPLIRERGSRCHE
jgi:hypothetical protein